MKNFSAKLLISLIIFLGTAVYAEPIHKAHEIDTVLITFFWFNTLEDLNEYFPDEDDRLSGYSECEPYAAHNFSHCDLYVVRPQIVDDEHTLTIGHEVLHGVYGDQYHEEVE